jgi:hypothetical protein
VTSDATLEKQIMLLKEGIKEKKRKEKRKEEKRKEQKRRQIN